MTKDEKLTDKLASLENEFMKAKTELKSIETRMNISYDYETELNVRITKAQKDTKDIRSEYYIKVQDIQQLIQEMKQAVSLYTGNFLNR